MNNSTILRQSGTLRLYALLSLNRKMFQDQLNTTQAGRDRWVLRRRPSPHDEGTSISSLEVPKQFATTQQFPAISTTKTQTGRHNDQIFITHHTGTKASLYVRSISCTNKVRCAKIYNPPTHQATTFAILEEEDEAEDCAQLLPEPRAEALDVSTDSRKQSQKSRVPLKRPQLRPQPSHGLCPQVATLAQQPAVCDNVAFEVEKEKAEPTHWPGQEIGWQEFTRGLNRTQKIMRATLRGTMPNSSGGSWVQRDSQRHGRLGIVGRESRKYCTLNLTLKHISKSSSQPHNGTFFNRHPHSTDSPKKEPRVPTFMLMQEHRKDAANNRLSLGPKPWLAPFPSALALYRRYSQKIPARPLPSSNLLLGEGGAGEQKNEEGNRKLNALSSLCKKQVGLNMTQLRITNRYAETHNMHTTAEATHDRSKEHTQHLHSIKSALSSSPPPISVSSVKLPFMTGLNSQGLARALQDGNKKIVSSLAHKSIHTHKENLPYIKYRRQTITDTSGNATTVKSQTRIRLKQTVENNAHNFTKKRGKRQAAATKALDLAQTQFIERQSMRKTTTEDVLHNHAIDELYEGLHVGLHEPILLLPKLRNNADDLLATRFTHSRK